MTDTRDDHSPEDDPQPFDDWDHREAAKKINGIYANQVYVQPLADGMLRINFGEVLDYEPSYHTAIVVTPGHALLISDLVGRTARAMLAPAGTTITPTAASKAGHGDE